MFASIQPISNSRCGASLPPPGERPCRAGASEPVRAIALRNPNPRAGAHPKATRRRPARLTARYLAVNALAKIPRIRLAHDPPGNTENHKPIGEGTPAVFLRSDALGSAFRAYFLLQRSRRPKSHATPLKRAQARPTERRRRDGGVYGGRPPRPPAVGATASNKELPVIKVMTDIEVMTDARI